MSTKNLFAAFFGVTLFAASADAQSQTCQWQSPYDGFRYHGVSVADHGEGPLNAPIVVLDFWGSYTSVKDTSHKTFQADMGDVLGDPAFWDRYQQYGAPGTGSLYATPYFNNATANGVINRTTIEQLIDQNDIPAGLPVGTAPSGSDYLDVIVLPPGVSSSNANNGVADGQGFGFHNSFVSQSTNKKGVKVRYAVINSCSPTSSNEAINTVTASHEIMEATTDPDLGQGYVSDHPTSAEAFGDNSATPEIGDLCNGMQTSVGPASHPVTSQQSWLQSECRCDASATHNDRSFQVLNANSVLVQRADGTLWWERAPFGGSSPPREEIDANVRTFQGIGAFNVFVLGNDGKLWYEFTKVRTGWNHVPPLRDAVDRNVESFQALDLQNVLVLGTDRKLWLEEAPFVTPPPKRQLVDQSVRSYQGIDTGNVFVIRGDGNLWLEHAPFATTASNFITSSVDTFSAVDLNDVFVLDANGSLWLMQGPWGSSAQKTTIVGNNVTSFKAVDANTVYVLDTNNALSLQSAPFGNPLATGQPVDGNVLAFDPFDAQTVYVLGRDGKLWRTPAPFGQVPNPSRRLVDTGVQP